MEPIVMLLKNSSTREKERLQWQKVRESNWFYLGLINRENIQLNPDWVGSIRLLILTIETKILTE